MRLLRLGIPRQGLRGSICNVVCPDQCGLVEQLHGSKIMERGCSILGHAPVVPRLINNENVVTETRFDVFSPLTNSCSYQSSSASVEEAQSAASAAQSAFPKWSKLNPSIRRGLLWKAADLIDTARDEMAHIQHEETGAEIVRAFHNVTQAADMLRTAAAMVSFLEGTVPTTLEDGQAAVVLKEPYGVILGIAPWYT